MASTETYIKELARHLCALDYACVRGTFQHTLPAVLEALVMRREDP